MTLYGLIASLAWAALAARFVSRLDAFATNWLAIVNAKRTGPEQPAPVVVPDDLQGLALGETEKWAQDSVMDAIRERWEQYKDWNKVRTAMGVAQVHQS